jgi:hypothetical protein
MVVVVEQAKAQRHQTTQTPGRQAAQVAGVQVEQAAPVGQAIPRLHLRLKVITGGMGRIRQALLPVAVVAQVQLAALTQGVAPAMVVLERRP